MPETRSRRSERTRRERRAQVEAAGTADGGDHGTGPRTTRHGRRPYSPEDQCHSGDHTRHAVPPVTRRGSPPGRTHLPTGHGSHLPQGRHLGNDPTSVPSGTTYVVTHPADDVTTGMPKCQPTLPPHRHLTPPGSPPAEGLEGDRLGLRATPVVGVEARQLGHLLGRELEVEHVDVLGDAAGFVDFGITERPSWSPHRSMTWPALLPWASAMAPMTGSSSGSWPVPVEGDAADRRPRLGDDAVLASKSCTGAAAKYGWHSIWLTAGTTDACVEQRGRGARP